jgi:diaminohydroxyphosphoribosylaminopyrimidine deaminase/5-amino-6-(5-phosphoribosylamino)uracil reductase
MKMKEVEESLMGYVFGLAVNGEGYVEPNPLVGALIVKNGQLLSVGYHRFFGGPHAEIEAINRVSPERLKGSSLFVNLEPCCHTDKKTPPCLDTITGIKFKSIYISNADPNPKVNGNAIKILKDRGYKVKIGILEEEGKWLNRAFFKCIRENIPYIVLKIATTPDGKIGMKNRRIRITSLDAIEYAKQERDKFNAILVGANTVAVDNPVLLPTVKKLGIKKIFYRIILSTRPIKSLINKKIFKTATEGYPLIYVTVFGERKSASFDILHSPHIYTLCFKTNRINIVELLKLLYMKFNMGKIIVEGGAKVFRQFFDANLYDEIHLYKSDKLLNREYAVKLFEDNIENKFSHLKLYEVKKFSATTLFKFVKRGLL